MASQQFLDRPARPWPSPGILGTEKLNVFLAPDGVPPRGFAITGTKPAKTRPQFAALSPWPVFQDRFKGRMHFLPGPLDHRAENLVDLVDPRKIPQRHRRIFG
jgi:hypothetical protein